MRLSTVQKQGGYGYITLKIKFLQSLAKPTLGPSTEDHFLQPIRSPDPSPSFHQLPDSSLNYPEFPDVETRDHPADIKSVTGFYKSRKNSLVTLQAIGQINRQSRRGRGEGGV